MNSYTMNTPIQQLNEHLFIKREDLIPFSFGGNKARKARLFFEKIDAGEYDCVVTYGSSSSNHCRVVANMAAKKGVPCIIITPTEECTETFNSKLVKLFGAEIITVPVECVHETIEEKLEELKRLGKTPYFIPGGGHGNIGTQAYVDCYDEIKEWEKLNNIFFDYIFFASGTGTTQAGLVCGQLINKDDRGIVGISIARKTPYGRDVILGSINDYLLEKGYEFQADEIENNTVFIDDYLFGGYGKSDNNIMNTIKTAITNYGIPLDKTYTGKAFYGMMQYIKEKKITGKKILFIHTGGTPLFFDSL